MKSKLYALSFFVCCLFVDSRVNAQANTALSNLAATSVNQDLVPATTNARTLGSATKSWKYIRLGSGVYLKNLLTIHSTGINGFFAGPSAGNATLTGAYNTGIGTNALVKLTTGTNNTGVGYNALGGNKTGVRNTGIGNNALFSNVSGGFNVAVGNNAMFYSTTGSYNVAIGEAALNKSKTSSGTVAIGDNALYNNDNAYNNVAIGSKALYSNTTGYYNVAVGFQALYSNTVSGYNTALGYQALYATTGNAYDNTGTGYQALYRTTTGSRNTANGVWALLNNTTGSNNNAVGVYALEQNTDGSNNDAMGYYSLFYNTSGYSNIAIGTYALFSNKTGHNLVAIGDSALVNQTTNASGFYVNTAVGSKALSANTTGYSNTATGFQALRANVTGSYNTGLGGYALTSSTGSGNTAVGLSSLYNNTSGGYNVAVGLSTATTNQTGSYITAVGTYANVNSSALVNATALGYNAIATASNQVMLGNTAVTSVRAAGSYVIYSDGRFKKDLQENVPGLEFINELRPVTYHYKIKDLNNKIGLTKIKSDRKAMEKDKAENDNAQDLEETAIAEKEKKLYTGFVAQEVEEAAKKLKYDFSGVYIPQNDNDTYGLSYGEFVVPLVKAVQQLSRQNDSLKEQNALLEARLARVESYLKVPGSGALTLSGGSINQNSPNPFRGSTVISYSLPQQYSRAVLVVYDAGGKPIKQFMLSGNGIGTVRIDASTIAAGEYNYSLFIDHKLVDTKKMIIMK